MGKTIKIKLIQLSQQIPWQSTANADTKLF